MSNTAKIIDGKALSALVVAELRELVDAALTEKHSPPGLGVVLVGDNPASRAYVANKENLAKKAGFKTFNIKLSAEASFAELESAIHNLNENPEVHGILVQLPLPKALNANAAIDLIKPSKDADGLHPYNQGLLLRGSPQVRPCTPLGVMHLIDLALSNSAPHSFSEIKPVDLAGKNAVVIGRSILVGKPLGLLLLERNATVTFAHSKTADLPSVCRNADILVAAVGKPLLVKKEWVKPGAVVIDVGINRTESGALVGDVDFESVSQIAGAITPVPGGVGPMTVAMLIWNTWQNYLRV